MTSNGWLNAHIKTGNRVAAIIEANDTNPVKRKIPAQIKSDKKRTGRMTEILIVNPIKTPKLVAMPFPPLKSKKIVQLCPATTINPRITSNIV